MINKRDVLRAFKDLEATARTMYELDHRKVRPMTVCKVALATPAMWTRDHYFPPTYAHATWQRLVPFFRLTGWIVRQAKMVLVELRPFIDRQLNRDLAVICARVHAASPRLALASSSRDRLHWGMSQSYDARASRDVTP